MITIEQLTKSYGTKQNSNLVLRGIDLDIPDGAFIVILGASGSGKSTLLHIISGLEYPDSGSVKYQDQDITTLSDQERTQFRKETVGFIFQQYYLLPHLTVEKNVQMGADLVKNQDYHEMIAAVGLKDKMKSYPSELSGGEQQRVAIARALAKKPKILFLDEPTGALDEQTGRNILHYITELHQKWGFTMVMVTHNENIAEMADQVVLMNSGRVTQVKYNSTPKTAYEIGW
ncbi:MAG: ABC transporter ATP-binding protein [Prevotella sp.]|nr:ABC transporter ATP-binding protein [Staphylococcus sp.]MCM1350395.1 ABC transporter ATP-binding protein [Prevotella sp.]